jgi:hypothetical protein
MTSHATRSTCQRDQPACCNLSEKWSGLPEACSERSSGHESLAVRHECPAKEKHRRETRAIVALEDHGVSTQLRRDRQTAHTTAEDEYISFFDGHHALRATSTTLFLKPIAFDAATPKRDKVRSIGPRPVQLGRTAPPA